MNKEYLLQPCAICNTVPKMKEHHDDDGLRAIYIDCQGCNVHGPFIHVHIKEEKERLKEVCSIQWNNRQLIYKRSLNERAD